MNTNGSFKMSKQIKRMTATFTNLEQRSTYKKLMINAQTAFEKAKRESGKQKRNDGGEE